MRGWALGALLAVACATHERSQDAGSDQVDPAGQASGECVNIPQSLIAHVDRSSTLEQATAGCRSFGPDGCETCCLPTRSVDNQPDCLVLNERGEVLKGDVCDEGCIPCARCSLAEEANLLAGEQGCDCALPRDAPGFDPAVPCERVCYYLASAIHSCSHLACE